jgi:hypothetical protein
MLSENDGWELMTLIKHLDSRMAAREDAALFTSVINASLPDVTLANCKAAVAVWYGMPHDYSRIMPGDVVAVIKAKRPASRLTENQITDLLIARGLTGDELWAGGAPAMVRRLVNQGTPLDEAVGTAADKWRGHMLEPPERQPRKHIGHHFAGRIDRMNLNDVLGETI